MRIAGVMSGTSLDGIDVAIVDVRGRGLPDVIGFRSTPYSAATRQAILAVSDTATHTSAISRLNYQLAELYSRAVNRAMRRFGKVELIGCHGQTVFHEGRSNTLQLGEPAILAERTGLPVISNFRARDIAAGGQGAPLVPFVDYLLFRHPRRMRIALNIGGIANITVIPPGALPHQVVAFDTGPGNMVIDALVRDAGLSFDRGGRIAQRGSVNRELLDKLLSDRYYRLKPPKSAGREQYGEAFVDRIRSVGLSLEDRIATATVLTAATIASAVRRYPTNSPRDLIVSGGGAHNQQIMAHLSSLLPGVHISTSSDHGVDIDAKEAVAFAVLAFQTWRRRIGNLSCATGARHAVVLGSITP